MGCGRTLARSKRGRILGTPNALRCFAPRCSALPYGARPDEAVTDEPGSDSVDAGLFRQIIVWRRLGPASAVRNVCFEDMGVSSFCVQSCDYFNLPFDPIVARQHDVQMLELLIEEEPGRRSSLYPTLVMAIERHDADFRDTWNKFGL